MSTTTTFRTRTRGSFSTTFGTHTTSPSTSFVEYHRDALRPATTTPERSEPRIFADDPFRARFGIQLPRGLREEAYGMDWRTFTATYSPASTVSIRHLESTRLRMGKFRFEADINGTHQEIIATGPVSACTHLLADAGRRVEILSFHQFDLFQATVTFIYTMHEGTRAWAMGFGATRDLSAAAALSSASQRLHG
ncbi:acetyl-CoA acetyltransferase [Corynebacterium aquilae]|uniref:Acetyl-CoA acetyltransferase n=1 Tax=Corynebacterium aquilae DSM 44791 TaxID=1431546 RepID=A0A1L7CI29_9CORY|nr:acetyl-CoA acetyltransferase [Corynebacterium aquilae]APT85516.1 acetyl-CoA acetyltransferase [Corynebacterium aquilae DSM 44791]